MIACRIKLARLGVQNLYSHTRVSGLHINVVIDVFDLRGT